MTSWLTKQKKQALLDLSSDAGLTQYVSMRRTLFSLAHS